MVAAGDRLSLLNHTALHASSSRRIKWIGITYPAKVTQAKADRAGALSVVVA